MSRVPPTTRVPEGRSAILNSRPYSLDQTFDQAFFTRREYKLFSISPGVALF